jgi:hypothetical protein
MILLATGSMSAAICMATTLRNTINIENVAGPDKGVGQTIEHASHRALYATHKSDR